jgi:lysophospholipase L1-like esterase
MLHRLRLIIYQLGLLLLGFYAFPVAAQTVDSTVYLKYKYIKRNLNCISNDSVALHGFYEKLKLLDKELLKTVSIVHIGDSHLQADFFSGSVRQKMQLRFGNAGRGLIFPFRVAKSNEPTSYKTTTNNSGWDARRNTFPKKTMPIGLSGFTIETEDTDATLNLLVKDQPGLCYSFTQFTLLHDNGKQNYDLTLCDEDMCVHPVFKSSQPITNPFVSELKFDKPVRQVILRSEKNDTLNQKKTRIYGMILKNDSAGVLYHMIGANGAEFRHYNQSEFFMEQLPYLEPNLIIISLGTNEVYRKGFNPMEFQKQIDTLVINIRKNNAQANILISTPPDSYRRGRKGFAKNSDIKKARTVIIDYCLSNNIAYWDLYEIMGGYGSMGKWYSSKLAAKDRIHFSARGYLIQGDLLYRALMKGYSNFLSSKGK